MADHAQTIDVLLAAIEDEDNSTQEPRRPTKRKLPASFFAVAAGGNAAVPQDEARKQLPVLTLPSSVSTVYTRSMAESDELCEAIAADVTCGQLGICGLDIEWMVSQD